MAGDGSPLGEPFRDAYRETVTDAMQLSLVQGISLGEGPRTVARRLQRVAMVGQSEPRQ